MSDVEPQVPEPMPETVPEPEPAPDDPAPAADPVPAPETFPIVTTETTTAGAADPRDERITELEQENLSLRSQVADLLAELAAPAQPPDAPAAPSSPEDAGPSAPTPLLQGGFDPAARTDELIRQGVPANDAAEQARYEKKLFDDRQAGGVQPA